MSSHAASGLPDLSDERYIGLTTTIPVEAVFAAGLVPVDLNNIFITAPAPALLVREAEKAGYPRTCCGWVRGIYATAVLTGIKRVIAVVQGDCSQTHAMMETWQAVGIEVIPFAYPYERDRAVLAREIERFCARLGCTVTQAEQVRQRLRPIRERLARLDELTWRANKVTGLENHLWQVQSSDFNGSPEIFDRGLRQFLSEVGTRQPFDHPIRLGYMGVPPIITDLYEFLEERGARVVFNETQRQFTMVDGLDEDLVGQYLTYTYPYSIFFRLKDVVAQIRRRRIDGLIHYVQSFCFRQIQDAIVKRSVPVPVLTIEGDAPGPLDARTRLRLEAFLETLTARRT